MGLFLKIFGQAKELTKLANSVANVKNMLDQFETDPDNTYLLCSAWICKVGIIDLIEKNGWFPNYIVRVPINGHQIKMYMTEVQMMTIGRLKNKVQQLNLSMEDMIDDILDGGPSFYEIDAQIPQKVRDIILKG